MDMPRPNEFTVGVGEAEHEELFFEGPELELAAAASTEPTKPKGRKKVARGKATEVEPEVALPEPEPEPVLVEAAPVPVPATVVVQAPQSRFARLAIITALSLALLASVASVAGLLVVSRTLAQTNDAKHEAEAQQAMLARLPVLMAEVELLAQRQAAALEQRELRRASGVATVADVRREIDGLKIALAKSQPPGNLVLLSTMRAGQSELSERIGFMADKLERLEQRTGMAAVQKTVAVSATPKATRAASPKHSS